MAERRLFTGPVPHVSTAAFHEHRERAPHLEQEWHRPRMEKAAAFVKTAATELRDSGQTVVSVSDLGCGDGGLLSLLANLRGVDAWGYDFQPSNAAGWVERGVHATYADVFGRDRDTVVYGDIVVCTEVLEHVADPHGSLRYFASKPAVKYLVCSSPWNENADIRDDCHAWAWDMPGYRALVEQAGFTVRRHVEVGTFQVILAVKP
jgi:cyclopropane fatty-acyl-phospholipid synthase-like methyltransferase